MQKRTSTPATDVYGEALPPPKWLDLGRVSIRYICSRPLHEAHGLPVVLLHEMGGSLETWDRAFIRLGLRHRVLAYDWRGAGHSEKISGKVTLNDHVDDLVALLDALEFDTPAVLAGCAVGAAIAAAFAAALPSRVKGLVLLSPAMGVTAGDVEARERAIEDFERKGMRGGAETSLAGGYPERFRTGQDARFASFRARWIANDPESFAAIYRMLLQTDMDPILAALACPVLTVGGEFDPVRTPEYVRGIAARIPNARFVTAPGGHHMPHQIPDVVAALIEEFAMTLARPEQE